MSMQARLVEVRRSVVKHNDVLAAELRASFAQAGFPSSAHVSSPGTGKTEFLEKTLTRLREDYRVAALVGDLATANDAERLARSGVPIKQIVTGTICHLEAQMVDNAPGEWNVDELDYLFIENVGNLVCPASYDRGEELRVVLMSVTEGEDKPLKYPTIFNTADIAVITRWIWPTPSSLTRLRLTQAFNRCDRVCGCSRCQQKPVPEWTSGWNLCSHVPRQYE